MLRTRSRYGLLPTAQERRSILERDARNARNRRKGGASDEEEEANYDDDFDGLVGSGDEGGTPKGRSGSKMNEREDGGEEEEGKAEESSGGKCPYVLWTQNPELRQEGMRFMTDITRIARKEEALKSMLKDGVPPSAPSLWSATVDDPEVGEDVSYGLVVLSFEYGNHNYYLIVNIFAF